MERDCDILIVGGGTGGVAAALAAASLGLQVVLTEESDWIGGQLTAQAVPPDEHPWIEQLGCTARYRRFRNLVREHYRALGVPDPNPGGGWVSRLCFEPKIGLSVLHRMLQPAVDSGHLELLLNTRAVSAEVEGDAVKAVTFDFAGESLVVQPRMVLDATELGDLLSLSGTDYVVGSESFAMTGEPHASETYRPDNVQAITWCFAMADDPGSNRTIDKPASYERWRAYRPSFWPGPLIGETDVHPITLEPRCLPFVAETGMSWFTYRQIRRADEQDHAITIVNWPMNDYFLESVIDVPPTLAKERLDDAKQLGLCLLYWMQTQLGLTGLYLRPDITRTSDGFAKTPYFRESRRIISRRSVREQDVGTELSPGRTLAPPMPDSVGIGAYRIDLHPSTGGDNYLDISSLPFQISLESLIPVRMRNLIPACKNIGTTHITNGCYRLHPVEWNIGEAAGLLAAFCLLRNQEPAEVNYDEFRPLLIEQGLELSWPEIRPL